jgi:hypothetical protein
MAAAFVSIHKLDVQSEQLFFGRAECADPLHEFMPMAANGIQHQRNA